jgi:hypothetical protein
MDSEKVEPAPEPAPAPAPVQGHPAAQYTLFEKLLRKTAKILRQSR